MEWERIMGGRIRSHFILKFAQTQKKSDAKASDFFWWGRTDSNHRSETQQIYSLSPLATRELPHIRFVLEPVDGLEPPTY